MKMRRFHILVPLSLFVCAQAFPSSQHKKCRIEVSQVLEASIGRGPPYLAQILEKDPARAELIQGESHGDHHLSCSYKILLNAQPYRYRGEFSNTLLELKEAYCGSSRAKRRVESEILHSTDRCSNPLATPIWGYPLAPL
jgi:hypothetical protein